MEFIVSEKYKQNQYLFIISSLYLSTEISWNLRLFWTSIYTWGLILFLKDFLPILGGEFLKLSFWHKTQAYPSLQPDGVILWFFQLRVYLIWQIIHI